MPLATATRIGPYRILAPIGVGGMGEVYRARDTRLERDVAIKIVPSAHAADPARAMRFEREARLASGLNHPNIVTIYEVGVSEQICYIAMELVEGASLRSTVRRGPLPLARVLDIAVQIAEGLATAHAAGIVHRDLKPDNVMIRPDGCVKILDFGVATLVEPEPDAAGTDDLTASMLTVPGTVLGTPAYMSPEQAIGNAADFRSDQFAFGSMLYEMATGKRPFTGQTMAQTMLAIAGDDPEPARSLNPTIPAPLQWVIERCLAKDPAARYAATEDLARELRTLRDHLREAAEPARIPSPASARRRGPVIVAMLAALAAGAVLTAWLLPRAPSPLSFAPLTFQRGQVLAARFAPDGRSVVYSFSASGLPGDVYAVPIDGRGLRPLGLPGSQLLAVSRIGEVAVALNWRWTTPYLGVGTLARLPLEGGAARPVADDVELADWSADGRDLAVVRSSREWRTLEFPIGRALHRIRSDSGIFEMRVSPRGDRVGFAELVLPNGTFTVEAVDLEGHSTVLSRGWRRVQGLFWTPDGKELWFAAADSTIAEVNTVYAVTLSGRQRVVGRFPGSVSVMDVTADGKVLLTQARVRREMTGMLAGDSHEHDLTWLDYSFPASLSADGRQLLFIESGLGSTTPSLWLRTAGQPQPVHMGEGDVGSSLSPDGRWIAAIRPAGNGRMELRLVPTGTGQERSLPLGGLNPDWTAWLPDGRRLIVNTAGRDGRYRSYVADIDGAPPRPVTPDGIFGVLTTPDSKWLLAAQQQVPTLFPIDGGEPRPLVLAGHEAALREETGLFEPVAWGDNDHTIFIARSGVPGQILRLDLRTGATTPWKEIALADSAGVRTIDPRMMAAGGRAYVATFRRELSDLYVVQGLR